MLWPDEISEHVFSFPIVDITGAGVYPQLQSRKEDDSSTPLPLMFAADLFLRTLGRVP